MKIGGTTIKTPSSLQVDISDIDGEAYRSANGTMIRDRIAVKRKLNCEWSALTSTEVSSILSKITATSFTVTYLDPLTASEQTKTFYVGDRNMPVYRLVSGKELWAGLTCNFIEV